MKLLRISAALLLLAVAPALRAQEQADSAAAVMPQRTVTPVDIDDRKPVTVLHYYDKHGDPLKEPVMFLATLDTVTKQKAKPIYPLYNGVSVGVNFGDALFMAFGQRYASFDIRADVSLHNWFFPTVEAGVGFASDTPKDNNFSYRVRPSFYMKAGVNYNFMYKSDPAYQVYVGLRAAFTRFNWDVDGVKISSDYWGEQQDFNMARQTTTLFWGEALAGIKVKIVGGFSLGWDVRWHFPFAEKNTGVSSPWFAPGYGASSPFSMSVIAAWTFGSRPKNDAPSDSAE